MSETFFGERLEILRRGWQPQPDKPDETLEGTLRALWFAAAGSPRSIEGVTGELPPLDTSGEERLGELIRRRAEGEPLAYVTGRQSFMGLELFSGPEALIPRRETELLAGAAIEHARQMAARRGAITAVDVCTGAGNVALAIAQHVPQARVFGADLSEDAVELARRNALHLGLAGRATFSAGDLFAPFESADFFGRVDLVTCNPPYISSSRVGEMPPEISAHEPRLAFDGGGFGVDILLRLLSSAPRFLRPGGYLCFEIGVGQGPALARRVSKQPAYRNVTTVTDGAGEIRTIVAQTVD
jgi:release factor glutamine methyltransferase